MNIIKHKRMINIVLVDDSEIIRNKTKLLLSKYSKNINVIGECSDGRDVFDILSKNENVDIVLMDFSMKHMNGPETTILVTQKYPHIKVIAFSSHIEYSYKLKMLLAGASIYIVKGTDVKEIVKIIEDTVDKCSA